MITEEAQRFVRNLPTKDIPLFGSAVSSYITLGPGTDPPHDAPTVKVKNGRLDAWVHDGPCRRFWIEDHP